jgi:hypothetical protein
MLHQIQRSVYGTLAATSEGFAPSAFWSAHPWGAMFRARSLAEPMQSL